MKRNLIRFSLSISVVLLLLAACTSADMQPSETPAPGDPVSSDQTPLPPTTTPHKDPSGEEDGAIIENIQIMILESFPVQVNALVSGQLRDSCTSVVGSSTSWVAPDRVEIRIQTERPEDQMCAQVLVPFEINVAIDVEGKPAGSYTVAAGDVSETFTLQVDNTLPSADACQPPVIGTKLFQLDDPKKEIGFCFLYHDNFEEVKPEGEAVAVLEGEIYTAEGQEFQPRLEIVIDETPIDEPLADYVNQKIQLAGMMDQVELKIVGFGSLLNAILVEDPTGEIGVRDLYLLQAEKIYILHFQPVSYEAPEARVAMEDLYQLAQQTWTFLY